MKIETTLISMLRAHYNASVITNALKVNSDKSAAIVTVGGNRLLHFHSHDSKVVRGINLPYYPSAVHHLTIMVDGSFKVRIVGLDIDNRTYKFNANGTVVLSRTRPIIHSMDTFQFSVN